MKGAKDQSSQQSFTLRSILVNFTTITVLAGPLTEISYLHRTSLVTGTRGSNEEAHKEPSNHDHDICGC